MIKTKEKAILSWDTSDITEGQIKYLMEEENVSKENARESVYNDYDLFEREWEDTTDYLTELMKGHKYFKAEVHNFGWRKLSGQKHFIAENGRDLLSKILPDTENTFYMYKHGKGFKINNFHHDSPTGAEWYYITPISEREYNKNK